MSGQGNFALQRRLRRIPPLALFRHGQWESYVAQGGTFARASSATTMDNAGVLQTVGSNVLRATDCLWSQASKEPHELLERAATNDVIQNRDLTDVAWTATNVTTARSTGIDGVASAGSRLTATAGNGTVIVTTALVHASAARAASLCIKRVTGTGNIQVTLDNGSTWTTITVTGTYAWVPNAVLQTLANSQFGIRIVTSGDAVDVDYCQNEAGTESTSPIAVAGSAVTRAADAFDFSFPTTASQLSQTGVTIYEDYIITATTIVSGALVIGNTGITGNNVLSVTRNTSGGTNFLCRLRSGAVDLSSIANTVALTLGDRIERLTTVTAAGAITLAVSVNGGATNVSATSVPGGWPAAFDNPRIYLTEEATAARKGGLSRKTTAVYAGLYTMAQMRQMVPL